MYSPSRVRGASSPGLLHTGVQHSVATDYASGDARKARLPPHRSTSLLVINRSVDTDCCVCVLLQGKSRWPLAFPEPQYYNGMHIC
jgi:hypothetical protein